MLLLEQISNNKGKTITGLIGFIFRETKIPVSTLKLNTKILKEIGMIDFFNGDPVRLTGFGKFVLGMISAQSQNGVKASIVGCKLNSLEKNLSKKQRPPCSCSKGDRNSRGLFPTEFEDSETVIMGGVWKQ